MALYLSYVETQMVEAVCGPVGDCNTVQSSPYSRLFGVLPMGVVGAVGYVAILAAWLVNRLGSGRWPGWRRRPCWSWPSSACSSRST